MITGSNLFGLLLAELLAGIVEVVPETYIRFSTIEQTMIFQKLYVGVAKILAYRQQLQGVSPQVF